MSPFLGFWFLVILYLSQAGIKKRVMARKGYLRQLLVFYNKKGTPNGVP